MDRHTVSVRLERPLNVSFLTPLEPESRFGEKLLEIRLVCPQNWAAVLKGLRSSFPSTPPPSSFRTCVDKHLGYSVEHVFLLAVLGSKKASSTSPENIGTAQTASSTAAGRSRGIKIWAKGRTEWHSRGSKGDSLLEDFAVLAVPNAPCDRIGYNKKRGTGERRERGMAYVGGLMIVPVLLRESVQ